MDYRNKERLRFLINRWKNSEYRKNTILGDKYYKGEHDILYRKRTVIGSNGNLIEVVNLPNNKIIDNQYSKVVDQKVNYLFSKPITINSENEEFKEQLNKIFNNRFNRLIKNIAESSLNSGVSFVYIYYDELGEIKFKVFDTKEILPIWKDSQHRELDYIIRLFIIEDFENGLMKTKENIEVYSINGIDRYLLKNNSLEFIESLSYISRENKQYNWGKLPIIPFKYNNNETPLLSRVKSLQDGINIMLSDFSNNMQEDSRNTILVVKNYDGENLGEFRKNLSTYGAVKVKTVDGAAGEVNTLTVSINSENYKVILEMFKKAIIENARAFDSKSDKLGQSPNQMNIQSMYSDIDLDANCMETEFQASFEELLWFIKIHIYNKHNLDFTNEVVEVIFNRDILINESETISNCKNSVCILSSESIVSQHPWVTDVTKELERLEIDNQIKDTYDEEFSVINGD